MKRVLTEAEWTIKRKTINWYFWRIKR